MFQIIAWSGPNNKPLFELMVVSLLMHVCVTRPQWVNTLRSRQNGRHFADDIFKCIFFNENVSVAIKFSLKFVPNGPINNIPALAPSRRQAIIRTNDGQFTDAYTRWVNSVLLYVRSEVFHDVSLMYDKCSSGICLMYDKCSSGICLMYESLRT